MDKLYWIVCEEGETTLFEGRHLARTRGSALKLLKEQIGRASLKGVVFTITEVPVPLIRELVAEILAEAGSLPAAPVPVPPSPPAPVVDPAPRPKRPKPAPAATDGKVGNPGFGDEVWAKVEAFWKKCGNYRVAAEKFGLPYHTVKTRARRKGWKR